MARKAAALVVEAPASTPEPRLRDLLEIERGFWSRGVEVLAGLDEVGRGPLAGPVLAAAVVMPRERLIAGADDSKKLTAARRRELAVEIRGLAVCVGVGAASPREIDRINILRASALAMQRALRHLSVQPQHLLVDGLPLAELGGSDCQTAVVAGDQSVHAIACASIIAKVCRDLLMERLGRRYPEYGWERNKGYATAEHLEALNRLGPTPHHRRSFHSVEQLTLFPT